MSRLIFSLFLFVSVLISCGQKKINDQDYSRKSIFDNAYMLTPNQVDSLNFLIKKLEQNVGSQVAIWTQVSLDNRNIDSLSYELFKKWGLGRKIQNDGILIFISLKDRQVRIEVGQGLENIIKDELQVDY